MFVGVCGLERGGGGGGGGSIFLNVCMYERERETE